MALATLKLNKYTGAVTGGVFDNAPDVASSNLVRLLSADIHSQAPGVNPIAVPEITGVNGSITAFADQGSDVRATAASHGMSVNEWVTISDTSAGYDGTYQITLAATNSFDFTAVDNGTDTGSYLQQNVNYSFETWLTLEVVIAPVTKLEDIRLWGPSLPIVDEATDPDVAMLIAVKTTGVAPQAVTALAGGVIQHLNYTDSSTNYLALTTPQSGEELVAFEDETDYLVLQARVFSNTTFRNEFTLVGIDVQYTES